MSVRNPTLAQPFRAILNAATPHVAAAPRPVRRQKAQSGECAYCDREGSNSFHPPHDASPRCESGKHSHCSCDTCF